MKITARTVRVSDVVVPEGRRPINPAVVTQIAESVNQSGLLHPITLNPSLRLIAGAHRLEAVKTLGWDTIEARILDGAAETDAELVELDENLIRSNYTKAEEARLWLRRKKLYLRIHPETRKGQAQASAANRVRRRDVTPMFGVTLSDPPSVPSFVSDTAAKLGKSEATIAAGVKLAEDLDEQVDQVVNGTPVANNVCALRRIADAGDPMAQVEKAKEEVEKAAAPRGGHLRVVADDRPPVREETRKRDEKIVAMLGDRLTPREVAKKLGVNVSVIQAAKKRAGLARELKRNPIGRIGEMATQFAESLGDLMAAAERDLASAEEDQIASTVEALDKLAATARKLKVRLKKEAGIKGDSNE